MARAKRFNPFYAVLVVVGVAFTITAAAYFVMALRGNKTSRLAAGRAAETEPPHRLLVFLDRHGVSILSGELGLLALATWGAIGTDQWWSKDK